MGMKVGTQKALFLNKPYITVPTVGMIAQILEWEILVENPVTGCFLVLSYDYVRAFVIVIMIVFSKKEKKRFYPYFDPRN